MVGLFWCKFGVKLFLEIFFVKDERNKVEGLKRQSTMVTVTIPAVASVFFTP
jgi:hypothetical protein